MTQLTFTGDPFIDVGGLVKKTLPQNTIEDKLRFVTDVYVDAWKGKINAVFLHSKITTIHASGKPERQRNDSLKYYLGVLQNEGSISDGYCRICTHKGSLFVAGRENYPLTGSGEFVNFYHFHEDGLLVCKDCLIKLYLLPMGVLQCGGNLMLLQVQNKYTEQLWQKEIIENNLDRIHRGSSEGILKLSLLNPRNALFYFAAKMIEQFKLFEKPAQQLRLFYFTNFATNPNVEIHDLPNPVFSFLKRVLKPDLKKDWLYLVKKHYRFRKSVHFDEESKEWIEVKKKESIRLDIQEYGGINSNRIYDYLLSGKSILRILYRNYKSEKLPIMIAITYMKEVRKMRQEQIDLIRKIADKIIYLSQKENNFKKFITPIEGARYAYQLRTAILRLVKTHYKNGEAEPFVRFNDYVEFLFPDGQSWYEVRDFLLICLYEKLHDLRINPAQISDETISETIEVETDSIDAFNQ